MPLTGKSIRKEFNRGRIAIEPFKAEQVTDDSYDLTLGPVLLKYTEKILDPRKQNEYKLIEMSTNGHPMAPGDFLLGSSNEIIGSDHFAPRLHGKSSIARLGLFVHINADRINIGDHQDLTFTMFATLPVQIYPGMKIAQITFDVPQGEIEIKNPVRIAVPRGPQPSQSYKEFKR